MYVEYFTQHVTIRCQGIPKASQICSEQSTPSQALVIEANVEVVAVADFPQPVYDRS